MEDESLWELVATQAPLIIKGTLITISGALIAAASYIWNQQRSDMQHIEKRIEARLDRERRDRIRDSKQTHERISHMETRLTEEIRTTNSYLMQIVQNTRRDD